MFSQHPAWVITLGTNKKCGLLYKDTKAELQNKGLETNIISEIHKINTVLLQEHYNLCIKTALLDSKLDNKNLKKKPTNH